MTAHCTLKRTRGGYGVHGARPQPISSGSTKGLTSTMHAIATDRIACMRNSQALRLIACMHHPHSACHGHRGCPPPRANRTAPRHFIFTPTNFHPSDPQIHSGVSSLSSLDLRDFAHAVRCPAAPGRSPVLSQTRVFAFSGSGPRPGSEERMRNRRGGRRPPGWVCTRTDRVRRNVHIKRAASADRTESRRERESRRPVISWILAMTQTCGIHKPQ